MKKKILAALMKPLSFINAVLFKKKNRIFIYSNLGFRDNVRAVYDELIKNEYNKKYEIICSLNDFAAYLDGCPENVRMVSNKKGIWYFLTSKYAFYSFGKYPIVPSKKQVVINVWHGMPLKRIGNMEEKLKHNKYDYFSYVIATSPLFVKIMMQVFNCEEKRVLLCGQPRTDALFEKKDIKEQYSLFYGRNREYEAADEKERREWTNCKKIVWLPTYRDGEEKEILPTISVSQIVKLNELLKENHIMMWVKLHPLQKYVKEDLEKYSMSHFHIFSQNQMRKVDLYEILSFSDALITDYSSVYFDYLMLDRPIGFMVGDVDQYDLERGFVFEDPFAYMPGQKIRNYEELSSFITDFSLGKDAFGQMRQKVNQEINTYCDAKNAQRLLEKAGIRK